MTRNARRLGVALMCAAALGVAACGGDDDEDNASSRASAEQAMDDIASAGAAGTGVESGAAELRAALTAQLNEHVYLAGIAVSNGVGAGLDSGEFKAAAATLDENSKDLARSFESAYGAEAGEQFLALWRAHIGFFVDYTKARATKDEKGEQKAKTDLDGYRAEFGAFLESANPNLTKEAVADELEPHVASLFDAIDSVVAGDGKGFDKLKLAASHMPMTARVLAGAIARQKPDMFDGAGESGASELRAALTAQLNEHVYLAGIAVSNGVGAGLDSGEFKAAAATLDENSKDLARSFESAYGAEAGEQFLALWRAHIGFFVDYTKARATKDEKGEQKAKTDLDGYRAEFGAFLESANPNLTKEAVADELEPHVASLFDAIDSVVAGDGKGFDKLKLAASHMPMTARVLAGAIAKQYPDKFSS